MDSCEKSNSDRLFEVMQTTTKMVGQLEGMTNLIEMMNKRLDKIDGIAQTSAVQASRLTQLENDNEQMRSELETLRKESIEGDAQLNNRVEKLEQADGAAALTSLKSLKKTIVSTIIGIMVPTIIANIGTLVQLFMKK